MPTVAGLAGREGSEMESRNGNGEKLPRRYLLGYLTSGAAVLGYSSLVRGQDTASEKTAAGVGGYCLYRWHTDNPVRFENSLKFTMEHGDNNHRFDNFFSVAYWYQTEPHLKFPVLPTVEERIPRVFQVGQVVPPSE
jgi:Protein of unknown function (DUF2961)